mgnify:FL=1
MSATRTIQENRPLPPRGRKRSASFAWLGSSVLLYLLGLSGCATWDLSEAMSWSAPSPKPQTPARMTDVWTDTVFFQPGQRGVRGFGGRVMFYGKDENKPIAVDGIFTVLAFDDTDNYAGGPPSDKRTPEIGRASCRERV